MAATKHRKGTVRAVLAGGLVLGVGAAMTLAAWNDSEFAEGTFTAGSFNIQGSTDDTTATPTWADHPTEGEAASLTFTADASALSPGDSVYAPFAIRVEPGTDFAADLTAQAPVFTDTGGGALADYLTASTFVSSYADCTAETPGTTEFTGTTLAQDGTPVTLCMVVTMDEAAPDSVQGQSAAAVWEFNAVSVNS